MALFDPCVRCSDVASSVSVAEKLGWKGICVILPPEAFEKIKSVSKTKSGMDVSFGIEIEVNRQSEIQKAVGKYRRNTEILAFRSQTAETNRAILETSEADMLLGGWNGGINHVMANIAKDNGVSVCFELQPLLFSHGRQRTEMFGKMLEAAKYLGKSRAPVAIGSGAQMPMDIRDAGELTSFGRLLGFSENVIASAISNKRVLENRKRLSGKWIMPGVETE